MTDRIHSLTVVLEKDMRDDDVQCVVDAIKMVRCVQDVVPIVADPDAYMAASRATHDWGMLMYDVLHSAMDPKKRGKLRNFVKQLKEEDG